eukprot:1145922-Pelagomonas_calceolata.AAC.7
MSIGGRPSGLICVCHMKINVGPKGTSRPSGPADLSCCPQPGAFKLYCCKLDSQGEPRSMLELYQGGLSEA